MVMHRRLNSRDFNVDQQWLPQTDRASAFVSQKRFGTAGGVAEGPTCKKISSNIV